MAASSLIISFVVLASASLAWFTLSTNPEIGGMHMTVGADVTMQISDDGTEYKNVVDLSDDFGNNLQTVKLKPVSTADGVNWMVAEYDEGTGNVTGDTFFQPSWCTNTEHNNAEHEHCDNGYYAYTDIWVKTTADNAAIRLSVPRDDSQELASGTYLLSYDLETDGTNNKVKIIEKGPETCARVGIMVFDDSKEVHVAETIQVTDSSQYDKFYILEPNADVRSELDKQDKIYKTDEYISGFKVKDMTAGAYLASDGKYMQTYPIQKTGISTDQKDIPVEYKEPYTGAPTVFEKTKLIVQSGAKWNTQKIQDAGDNLLDMGSDINSIVNKLMLNEYITQGGFAASGNEALYKNTTLKGDNTDYSPTELGTTSNTSDVLFNLEKGKPRQIRLFFWIEGQDVDCWNDVAGMNFVVRLEFATDVQGN